MLQPIVTHSFVFALGLVTGLLVYRNNQVKIEADAVSAKGFLAMIKALFQK